MWDGYVCAKLYFYYFSIIRSKLIRALERKGEIQDLQSVHHKHELLLSTLNGIKVLKNKSHLESITIKMTRAQGINGKFKQKTWWVGPESLQATMEVRKLMDPSAAASHLSQLCTEPAATWMWEFLPSFQAEAITSTVTRRFLKAFWQS